MRCAARMRGCATAITPIRFHGFVEGDDIAAGTVDVIVTDGFTGNVALKAIEGMAKLFAELLRASFRHSLPARIGYVFARGSLKKLAARLDPRRYNGAMFLGLGGDRGQEPRFDRRVRVRQCDRRRGRT